MLADATAGKHMQAGQEAKVLCSAPSGRHRSSVIISPRAKH